jgi:hypothetical protein
MRRVCIVFPHNPEFQQDASIWLSSKKRVCMKPAMDEFFEAAPYQLWKVAKRRLNC